MSISRDAVVVVGGADTQLAIKSTGPAVEDVVIVSGTTTPIVKIIPEYVYDKRARTWTNRHIDENSFILEANAGVTGLNYQRLKEIFYPNEGYDVIERELALAPESSCVSSLGSLVADEEQPMTKGGFIFDVPVSHQLTRACFVQATLWDIACCIKENYDHLNAVAPHQTDFIWGCGGGFQSAVLRQSVADLINKKVRVRSGFQHASVSGGIAVCNDALKISGQTILADEVTIPRGQERAAERYRQWKHARANFKKLA
jgi:autoinducer 2 (AI-2) kinase